MYTKSVCFIGKNVYTECVFYLKVGVYANALFPGKRVYTNGPGKNKKISQAQKKRFGVCVFLPVLARLGWTGLATAGLAWPGLAWLGWAGLGSAGLG